MLHNSFRFGNTNVGDGYPCFVIAEIGINHEGDTDFALEMVEAAARAGANAIKLQTADPNENYHPDTESYKIYQKSFLGEPQTKLIFERARSLGIEPFTTTGLQTLEWVERLNPAGYKISSGTLTHFPLIRKVAETGRPLLLSTGIATHDDLASALKLLENYSLGGLGVMQCTSAYPCPDQFVDLRSIMGIRKRYSVLTGFSDHTIDTLTPALSVAAGALFVEKHFSTQPDRPGFDHGISLAEDSFKEMVDLIRTTEARLGSAEMPLHVPDKAKAMTRYVVPVRDISQGKIIELADLAFPRLDKPGTLAAINYESVLGKRAVCPLKKGQPDFSLYLT